MQRMNGPSKDSKFWWSDESTILLHTIRFSYLCNPEHKLQGTKRSSGKAWSSLRLNSSREYFVYKPRGRTESSTTVSNQNRPQQGEPAVTIYKQIIRSCCNCLGITIRKIRCEYRKKACTSSIRTIDQSNNLPSLDCTLHARAVLYYNMSFYKRHAFSLFTSESK